jgi:hypothetical protein
MRITCFILLFSATITANGQPFLDIVNMRYQHSPDAGLNGGNNSNHFSYSNVSLNLPLVFKKDSSMIVFSPFTDRWNIYGKGITDAPDQENLFYSLALPLSYIAPLSAKWTLTLTGIPRWNGYKSHWFENSFQFGASVLTTYKKSNTLRYKFGAYYNGEFFGTFLIPLVGIDWQINAKNNLFGILPGYMIFEHKVSKRFYWGASFRSINNSYQDGYVSRSTIQKYIRIQDNQLAAFTDFYLSKNIVLNLEAGHSVGRRLRLGTEQGRPKYHVAEKMNNNLLLKASFAYRLRLREAK